ncbi:hypothetical protein [Ruegeria atlantica]|uniref:hypothetical protein n=1 Tax=Ruegeria atlantica TaxID=81569 RepID=UPI001480371E|nr:hypothetical protein [Ruegeria atlantica]
MKMGIGTPAQKKALFAAGAEKVIFHHEVDSLLEDEALAALVFRKGDTIILVQSNLLPIVPMKAIAKQGVTFEIPGHEPRTCPTDESIRDLRRLEPVNVTVEKREARGAKPVWPVPTAPQIETIVSLWHTPEMKRSAVVARVREIVGAEVPDHWVRDQVIKATGSGARKPQ